MKIIDSICNGANNFSNWVAKSGLQIIIAVIFILGVYSYLQNREVSYYYLDSSGPNRLSICTEINFFPNSTLDLKEGTTIEEAIEIVDRLNKSLKEAKK